MIEISNEHIKNKSLSKRIEEYKDNSTIYLKDYIVLEITIKNNKNLINIVNRKDYIDLYKEFILDISKRFQFNFVYFNNEKIIAIIKQENIQYKGNINKIISNIISYSTIKFNSYIYKYYLKLKKDIESSHFKIISQDKINYMNKIETLFYDIYLESEIYSITSKKEIFNSIYYYQNEYIFNSKINFLNEYGMLTTNINLSNIDTYLNELKEDTNYDWNDIHEFEKYGIIFKHNHGFNVIKETFEFEKEFIQYIVN